MAISRPDSHASESVGNPRAHPRTPQHLSTAHPAAPAERREKSFLCPQEGSTADRSRTPDSTPTTTSRHPEQVN